MAALRLHATCVAIGVQGVLLMGEPGAGKSDLALRLIDRGASLVADDQVLLAREGDAIFAQAPENIEGMLEVRGVGIFTLKAQPHCPLLLCVHLVRQDWIERLPYPKPYECLGVSIPQLLLSAFDVSSAIKIEMAVAAMQDDSMIVGAFKE